MFTSLRFFALASVASLGFFSGCVAPQSSLAISGSRPDTLFSQTFSTGVADARDAGDTDIVLTARTDSRTADAPAVQQVLHVRVLWQPGYKMKVGMQEVSANATFNWYVYPAGTSDAARPPQMVEYHGTGFVELVRDGEQLLVKVQNAKLTPTAVSGNMQDPLGTTHLSGTLVARRNRGETLALLADLRATVAAARNVTNSAEAKLPLGQ